MLIKDILAQMESNLKTAGIGTARLDSLVLLEDITKKDRAYLLAHPEYKITDAIFNTIKKQVKLRAQHIPLAQIRGKTEFFGREFIINKHVLEPRPESETMIDILRRLTKDKTNKIKTDINGPLLEDSPLTDGANATLIMDVGTGSGALGITAKLEVPDVEVILTDIDKECLKVASQNAKKHKVQVKVLESDLIDAIPHSSLNAKTCIILANLPYVPNEYEINRAALNEPKIAIFGGEDGLDLYRKLFLQIANNLRFKGVRYVFTESLPFQHKELAKIALKAGFTQTIEEDFIQLFVTD